MGLFSRPLESIRFLAMCLGIWGISEYRAIAQSGPANSSAPYVGIEELAAAQGPKTTLSNHQSEAPSTILLSDVNSLSTAKLLKQKVQYCTCPNVLGTKHAGLLANEQAQQDSAPAIQDEQELLEDASRSESEDVDVDGSIDDELGILRVRSRPIGIDSELGILRIRPTEDVPLEVEPEPTRQTTIFLTGRANIYGGDNLFRTLDPIDDRIYQAGIGIFAFPRLSSSTNLILNAEANLARYEDLSVVDYNETQVQVGIRQRLGKRSYGQLNWRHQNLQTPGGGSFFTANYAELLLSRRDILNNRTWLDTYYQARLSSSDPDEFSRFSQIATGSLNYGFDPQTRVSLIYQLFVDDYTQTSRHDTYHQILAQFSHDLSSHTRLSLFTGVRFGRSSRSSVNFDDTIYGASLNVTLPLF